MNDMSQSTVDHTPGDLPLDDVSKLTALDLSALLCSRVCHDLINPVGAIGSGLSMLDDTDSDADMREMADSLVREGTGKALALLSFARLAYGAAGGYGVQIKTEDAEEVLITLFDTTKATLDWQVPVGIADKNRIKVLLILTAAASECVPRGGDVTVTQVGASYHLTITGTRLFLNDDFVRALGGDGADIKPKYTPAYLAALLAREQGGHLTAARADDTITMAAEFAQT
ncbi:MAG: histidine phosphotransferase family protein [Pseudomonadota bacterium]